jgi:hypothetical protein
MKEGQLDRYPGPRQCLRGVLSSIAARSFLAPAMSLSSVRAKFSSTRSGDIRRTGACPSPGRRSNLVASAPSRSPTREARIGARSIRSIRRRRKRHRLRSRDPGRSGRVVRASARLARSEGRGTHLTRRVSEPSRRFRSSTCLAQTALRLSPPAATGLQKRRWVPRQRRPPKLARKQEPRMLR